MLERNCHVNIIILNDFILIKIILKTIIGKAFINAIGGKIGFFQGDIKKLSEDLKELKPTIFCTVPRLLNRVYSVVNQ